MCVFIYLSVTPPHRSYKQENAQEAECAEGEELGAAASHHDWSTALRSLGGLTAAGPLASGPPLVHQLTPKLIFYKGKEGFGDLHPSRSHSAAVPTDDSEQFQRGRSKITILEEEEEEKTKKRRRRRRIPHLKLQTSLGVM